MSTINLPDELSKYLAEQSIRRGYRSADEFLQELFVADRVRHSRPALEAMLAEAVDGPFDEWTEQDVEDIQREGLLMIEQRRNRRDGKR